jgi:hypothetical protein
VSQDDWERARRGVICPNCGASNWPDAEYCASCGTALPTAASQDQETIIDVSSGEPRVVVRDEPQPTGWTSSFPGFPSGGFNEGVRGRTVTMRGGRGCLIPLLLLALLTCCSCWLIWQGFDSVF